MLLLCTPALHHRQKICPRRIWRGPWYRIGSDRDRAVTGKIIVDETSVGGDPAQYRSAVARIDAGNRRDPSGWEHQHALAVVDWIEALRPEASDALRLAGRAQHMGRWRRPRDRYPRDRAGYLRWRRELQSLHADEAARLLAEVGYAQAFIDRVRSLMHKQHLRDDPEAQTLEDALCLVFIERQLEAFRARHDEAKLQRILERTWAKMSPAARQAALELSLPPAVRDLLTRSIAPAARP